jgi:hypothetical protein
MPLGAPDIDRDAVLSSPGVIGLGDGDRLPSGRIVYPRHHVVPAERPRFLGPQSCQQGQGDVGLQPGALRSFHQRSRLFQGERPCGAPSLLSFGRLDQRGDVAGYQVVAFGLANCPDQDVVWGLHCT